MLDSCVSFFFFKQKTSYEIRLSLVGSEMCIRDVCVCSVVCCVCAVCVLCVCSVVCCVCAVCVWCVLSVVYY